MQKMNWRILIGLLLALCCAAPVLAQGAETPWAAADAVREGLFRAQEALLAADPDAAAAALGGAQETAVSAFAAFTPEVRARLESGFTAGQTAVAAGDAAALAAARGGIQGAIYWGAYQQVQTAVSAGDGAAAERWLLVRDYRPSTRFARPDAEATLAVRQMGALDAESVAAQVDADLLDTYQARLNGLLAAAADSGAPGSRRAEAAAQAGAYWQIIAPAYAAAGGAGSPAAQFAALETAVLAGNEAQISALSSELLDLLGGFRAAPLAAAEQARRAAQLLRYLALVPVEYGRGVTDGVVMQEIEIQEALTFMDGAQAAFADLQLTLEAADAAQTAAAAALIDEVAANLRAANRKTAVVPVAQMEEDVAALNELLAGLFPAAWLDQNSDADFDVLVSVLDQVETAVRAGDYKLAESARLEAYAIFDFGPEPRLLAFAPDLVARIDGLFWQGYDGQDGLAQAIALAAPPAEVGAIRAELDGALEEAQLTLGDLPSSPVSIITNAGIIVFREGLESVVILAALMASMVGGYKRYRRPMVLGVLLALLGTAVTWWLAQVVLTSLSRYGEKLEAVVSLIAIAILLLITNWFFHKTYWTDWMKGFHQKKRRVLSAETGQFVGLVLLGFTSMYREGFETVLFLQALVLDAGPATVLQGVAVGSIGVIIVGIITFRMQQRLPYKKMLVYTGVLIGAVLLIMVGKTVHVLQAVGWVGITPIQGVTLPYWTGLWLGLYATWQGVIAQMAAAVFVIGSFYGAEYLQTKKRPHAVYKTGEEASGTPKGLRPLADPQPARLLDAAKDT
jgi:high-affinity iron transporter